MTVFVLGGGPAGLATVDGLVDAGTGRFVLIERSRKLGGLAQTLHWQDVGLHDLGPHKIFTLDEALMRRVGSLIPAHDWLTREKLSSIYMKGHYLPYPPSPFSLAGVFGLSTFVSMVGGYGMARARSLLSAAEPRTFEEDLTRRLGAPLYEVLFKPIALKLWGDPIHLDVKLSKGRVQTPTLTEVLGRLVGIKSSNAFEAASFRYPKGGLGRIWSAIEQKVAGYGEFYTGHTVTGLDVAGESVRAIQVRTSADGEVQSVPLEADDFVASTLPIALVVDLLGSAVPSDVRRLAHEIIILNDLLLVFLHVDTPSLMRESWVFVPDPDIAFHRLSEQESFDPGMTPKGSIVCCELMSSELRPMASRTDKELIERCVADVGRMGYRDFKVKGARVIRLPKSYPVYRVGYEAGLSRIMAVLDALTNFRTVGRQGSFNYIGTIDAMDTGYGFARWYAERDHASWGAERVRTSHYPVLD